MKCERKLNFVGEYPCKNKPKFKCTLEDTYECSAGVDEEGMSDDDGCNKGTIVRNLCERCLELYLNPGEHNEECSFRFISKALFTPKHQCTGYKLCKKCLVNVKEFISF